MSTAAAAPADSVPMHITLEGIRKSFSDVPVLRGIDLMIAPAEVLGIVGENGAGKSTLMNILGGDIRPDAGSMHVNGTPYRPATPSDARAQGISFVHQELTLFGNLTIDENLHLAGFPLRRWTPFIDRAASARAAKQLLQRVGLERSLDTLVERLSAGERQLVEIARALRAEARVLILDEPTTSLGAAERGRLHALIRELRGAGLSIVYISHELGDVLTLCDRVAVLRDGAVVASGSVAAFSVGMLVRHMVGREVEQLYPPRRSGSLGDPVLELRNVASLDSTRAVTLTVHRHELVGVFGLMGAGRSELARVIFGLDRHMSGEILLDGTPLDGGPAERIARGLAFVTEDRRLEGLCLEASVRENLVLASLHAFSRRALGIVNRQAVQRAIEQIRGDVRLTGAANDWAPVARLSGGNQQKVVLGKWLLTKPCVLILDEPTRGIDVGARAEIYQLLHRLADGGAGLLVISSYLDELMGICDRIVVMRQGEVGGRFEAPEFDRERLLRAALPASVGEG